MHDRQTPMRALVTDGQERWVVAVCRSLTRMGLHVTVAADSTPAVAHWSRFCRGRLTVPPARADPSAFLDALEQALSSEPYTLMLVCGEAALEVVSQHRERFEPHLLAPLGIPPRQTVSDATDKLLLCEVAAAAGLPCPETIACRGIDEALSAAEAIGYPVVAKPRTSVFQGPDGAVLQEPTRLARDPGELQAMEDRFAEVGLIQRVESGTVYSCSGVFAGGRLLAFSLARYLRTWPPEAGNAAYAETVAGPWGLDRKVQALIEAIGWEGIFELELLRRDDGTFVALDLNPRTFGSLALPIRAGADLPRVWCQWLLGERPEPAYAEPGVHYRWEDAELRGLVWRLQRGRIRSAAEMLKPRANTVHPHFAVDDPGPLLARALFFAGRAAERIRE